MAEIQQRAHLNLFKNQILNAILHPLATDPANPAEYQIWVNSTTGRIMIRMNAANRALALLDDVTSGSITGALWDAQSVVIAVSDDSPQALVVPEGHVLGRPIDGNVSALDAGALKTMLSLPSGAVANQNYVDTAIANLIDSAPGALDTLSELAAALQDNDSDIAGILTAQAGKAGKYSVDIGDGTATSIDIVHNLGSDDVVVGSRLNVNDEACLVAWKPISSNAIACVFNTAPSNSEIRVTVVG